MNQSSFIDIKATYVTKFTYPFYLLMLYKKRNYCSYQNYMLYCNDNLFRLTKM